MRLFTAYLIFLTLICIGCSGTKGTVTPPDSSDELANVSIAVDSCADGIISGTALMGIWELNIDYETLEVDLHPKRSSTIGESYIVEGTAFFTNIPCHDCLTFKGVECSPMVSSFYFT